MKKDGMIGLLLLGALGIGAYYLFTRNKQEDVIGGAGGQQQGALSTIFPPSVTNIYKTFNYGPLTQEVKQDITNTSLATGQKVNLPKEVFRPYGKKTLVGEISRGVMEKTGVLPGVLHELYLKETYRKNTGWMIFKGR